MPSYRARLTIGLFDSKSVEKLPFTEVAAEPPCDFLAHLNERLRLEGGASLELLGRWLDDYEPHRRPRIHFLRAAELVVLKSADHWPSLSH